MERVTLKGLLKSEDVAIVVPEIQREYVWGAKESIRNQFIDSLEMRKEQSQSVNLGFLYTYKRNAETYIIDGQQRFTTVILMLYFLSLASNEDKKDFKEIMKLDKAGMSFSYRVRSNTEQFMKDLFVSGLREKEEIKDSLWYHSYYDTDKSIQSMLGLLDYLNQRKQSGSLSLTYNKLLDVEFWCYPVEDTSMGEELYITMNSRGKALDNSEQTAFLKNGYLNMLAIRYWDPKKAGIEYAAPWAVTTQETMSYKYGYVEIRAKLPFVRGAWPSFWAVSSNALGPKTDFDYNIEVDIFENFASLDTIAPNIHKWYDDGEHTQWADENEKYTFSSTDINNEFHTYGFEWTPEKMTMYIDDKPYYTYDLSVNFDGGSSGMGGFDTQLYLLFNNHLFTASSDYLPYDGCEIYPTDVPTEYVIDYVRLYQKKDGISKLYTN